MYRVFSKWLKWMVSRQGADEIDYGVGVGFHEVRFLAGGVDALGQQVAPPRGQKGLATDPTKF